MKKDSSTKLIEIALCTIMIVLILLIVSFLIYIYNEQKLDKETIEFINISERKGEITAVAIPEDTSKEEEIVVTINPPTISRESSVTNTIFTSLNNKFYYHILLWL